jgi:hypothetical protein
MAEPPDIDGQEMSPLKQLQRMNATGTLPRYGTGRRRKSSSAILDTSRDEDLTHMSSLKDIRKCGSESPKFKQSPTSLVPKGNQGQATTAAQLNFSISPNNNNVPITGEGDVAGVTQSLVRSDTNGNVAMETGKAQEPALEQQRIGETTETRGPDDLQTEVGSGFNTLVVEDKNANVTIANLSPERRRSQAPIILPGAQTEPSEKAQNGVLPDRPASPDKVSGINVLNVNYSPIPKPVIEVKLVKNDSSRPSTPRSRHSTPRSTPRSTPPRVMYPRDIPADQYRISKSADDLDLGEHKVEDVIYCSVNLLRDVKYRHSFVDRNRDSVCNSIGEMNTLLKSEFPEDQKAYSLPQPHCYSDNTLKAVKQITEKYDTLQRRKMRAMSFRENSKFSPIEPGSPITQAALWNLRVEAVPGPVPGAGVIQQPEPAEDQTTPELETPAREFVDTFDEVVCVASGITRRDISRIDLFYRGRETDVIVCSCLVDMRMGMPAKDGLMSTWDLMCTGVPVFVLNTGLWKRRRELNLILADRETGFPIWQDKITYLTNYQEVTPVLHTMHVSNQLRKMVGLTFYCEGAAAEFLARFRQMTSDPNDDLWKVSTGKQEKKKKVKKTKFKKPSKKDISQPCNFTHITRVDPGDRTLYDSFQHLGIAGSPARGDFARPRLQTA